MEGRSPWAWSDWICALISLLVKRFTYQPTRFPICGENGQANGEFGWTERTLRANPEMGERADCSTKLQARRKPFERPGLGMVGLWVGDKT